MIEGLLRNEFANDVIIINNKYILLYDPYDKYKIITTIIYQN